MRCSKHLSSARRVLGVALAAGLVLAGSATAKLRVVATLPVFGEVIRAVGGDRVHVDVVGKELQDPHFIQPTPWSIVRVSRAQAFFCAGLDLELWRGPLLEAGANNAVFMNSPGYVDLSVGFPLLQIPLGNVSRLAGDVHQMGNPHYFYSPDGMDHVAANVVEALTRLDPRGAETFAANGQTYRDALAEAALGWKGKLAPHVGKPIVPFHNAFPYFEQWSGLRILDHVEPKPSINPSAAHLARLTVRMRREGVKVILHEPFYNRKFSESLARRTGAQVVTFFSQPGRRSRGTTYIEMMDANIDAIVAAMQ